MVKQPGKYNSALATRRYGRGFRAASSLLEKRIQSVAEGRGFAVTRLLTQWETIAGEDLARITRPVKISYGRKSFGATLTLLVQGASGPMIEMRLPDLREKVNACYGYNAISKIKLTQTSASGFAEGQARFSPKPASSVVVDPAKAEEAKRNADDLAARFADPELARAVAQLAYQRSKQKNNST